MKNRSIRPLARAVPLLVAGLALAACSRGEPSASDIEAALTQAIDAQMNQATALASGIAGGQSASRIAQDMAIHITDVDKIGCAADGEKAYRCDVRFKVSGGPLKMPPRELAQTIRLASTDNGWTILQ